jgi:hypothetical protein
MPGPFNSDKFFGDRFFAESFTVGTAVYRVVFAQDEAPDDKGALSMRPGTWGTGAVRKTECTTKPASNAEWTRDADSTVWRVDTVQDSGDVWQIRFVNSPLRKGA